MEARDDTDLIALACPHCEEVIATLDKAFKKLLFLITVCPRCGKPITKGHIEATCREYLA